MTLTLGNLLTFAPECWLLLGAAVAFVMGRLRPRAEDETSVVGLVALALALVALLTQLRSTLTIFDGAFLLDGYTRVLQGIVLAAAGMCLLLTLADRTWTPAPDFAGFLLLATAAAMLLAGGADLVSLALAIALLGGCVGVMVVAARPASAPAVAGVGAFIASTLATALVSYGFAFLYGLTGETRLALAGGGPVHAAARPAFGIALVLVIAGFGVLIGMVPVQWGLQAIFQRAPLAVCAFTGSVVLAAALGALVRVLGATVASSSAAAVFLAVLAAATMTGGTLAALGERSLRRLLAALLIGQAGYGLAALVGMREGGVAAALVLLASLAAGILAAVAAVIAYTHHVHSDRVGDLNGMATYAPGPALVLALALASLSGIPPLAGFFGKLLVLQSVVNAGFAWLALVGVLNTVVAAMIALRVIRTAFLDPPVFEVQAVAEPRAQGLALGLGALGVLAFGAVLGPLVGVATFGARAVLP